MVLTRSRYAGVLLAAAALCALTSYVVATRGAMFAAAVGALVAVGVWVVGRPGRGLILAIAAAVILPSYLSYAWFVAPALAALGLLAGVARNRFRWVDAAFVLWTLWVAISWVAHPGNAVDTNVFLADGLPLLLFAWIRLTVTRELLKPVLWTVLGVGTVGALTVLYESYVGHVVFNDPTRYQWAGNASELFRAGGVFGGSPAAAISLAMMGLGSLRLLRERRALVSCCLAVMLLAVVVTYARAGWISLVAGGLVTAALLPVAKPLRLAYVIALIASAGVLLQASLGPVTATRLYQLGIVRPGSYTARTSFVRLALPLVADTPVHLAVGRGFEALKSGGSHDLTVLQTPILLERGGPHNDYVRALIEQGALGLLFLLAWLVGSLVMGARTLLRLPRRSDDRWLLAGLTGAVVAFMTAGLFHDSAHNVPVMTVGALMTGLLVTAAAQVQARSEGREVTAREPD